MAEAPEFSDTFDVYSGNYRDFMQKVLLNHVVDKKYCSYRSGVQQPVLPREQKIPKLWFHVDLRTETTHLLLAIRMDNLYLVGFRTPGGVWWEFNNDVDPGTHLIADAKWLRFGGRYDDLIGHRKGLETVTLGRTAMGDAVATLAKYGTIPEEEEAVVADADAEADPYVLPKKMLARLVIMVCEGLRFTAVCKTLGDTFEAAAKVTKLEGKQVNEWYKISRAVLTWGDRPEAKFPDLEKVGIKNKKDAEEVVALVKDVDV